MKFCRINRLAFLLLLTLSLILAPKALAVDRVTAQANNIDVQFNGRLLELGAYNIANNNYVKLRDVAQLLSGTEKSVSVTWNNDAFCIELVRGGLYQPAGGELSPLAGGSQSAVLNSAKILLDGKNTALTAYNIGGSNFFKLRDLGVALDFYVGWDASTGTVIVDTTKGYSGAAAPSGGGSGLSDAELMALAEEAAYDINEMCANVLELAGLLPLDRSSTVVEDGWTYYLVPGCTSLAEIRKETEDAWYEKFSRKYDSLEWLCGGDYLGNDRYQERSGRVYMRDGETGIWPFTFTVDKLVSRTDSEAKFAGCAAVDDEVYDLDLSLVYEDGAWKYGYFCNGYEGYSWTDPNNTDQQMTAMARTAAERIFDWRLGVETGSLFAGQVDWDSSIDYAGWFYSRMAGYSSAAEARSAMEKEWYRHFSRRYTIEQVMGEEGYSNFTNSSVPYFAEIDGAVYMPELQWGGTFLTFPTVKLVSRSADEVVFQGNGIDRDFPDDVYKEPIEFSLVYENGAWKYGYYKNI